jgi:hypothetical protein
MIDALAILLSCGVLALVVMRAVKLDASLPWFVPLGGAKPDMTTAKPEPVRVVRGGMLKDKEPTL